MSRSTRDGELVGHVTSAGYGHTLGGTVALAWVQGPPGSGRDWFTDGAYQVEVAGERAAARVSPRPLYDPKSQRPRG